MNGSHRPQPGRRPARWHNWVIVGALVAIFVTGVVTVFDDELARLWGKDQAQAPVDGVAVPPPPGNAQGL